MNIEMLTMYSVVSFFYIISPGPAIFLAISNGMSMGLKSVSMSSFGNIVGLFLLSCASISGLGVILTSSATLFLIVKFIGALYLFYLGVKQFRAGKNAALSPQNNLENHSQKHSGFFKEGFLLAVTNPKPIIFFIALFPQFLSLDKPIVPQFFIMTAIFMFLSFWSLFSYGLIAKTARGLFHNQRGMMWFHRITGGLFIGMGVGLLQLKNAQS